MTIEVIILLLFGLAGGSFANAVVWRIHEQEQRKIADAKYSIMTGRSMCPNCHHRLKTLDLIPVISWLALRGKCRYCGQPISIQYPIVELLTAMLFVLSYLLWPLELLGFSACLVFVLWLAQLVALMALAVYDLRWLILPDRLIIVLIILALSEVTLKLISNPLSGVASDTAIAVLVGAGLFYALFAFSNGRWIGGGDVKLGFYGGLTLGWPAALVGLMTSFYSAFFFTLPLLIAGRLNRKSKVPFGPFIILGIMLAKLFTLDILSRLSPYWF